MPAAGGGATSSSGVRKRPFSALVEDILFDVSDLVDEAIGTHKDWIGVRKQEIVNVLDAAEKGQSPVFKSHKWGFYVEAEDRIGDIVSHHVNVLRTRLEARLEDEARAARPKRARTQPPKHGVTGASSALRPADPDVEAMQDPHQPASSSQQRPVHPPPSKKPQERALPRRGEKEGERQSQSYHSTRSWSSQNAGGAAPAAVAVGAVAGGAVAGVVGPNAKGARTAGTAASSASSNPSSKLTPATGTALHTSTGGRGKQSTGEDAAENKAASSEEGPAPDGLSAFARAANIFNKGKNPSLGGASAVLFPNKPTAGSSSGASSATTHTRTTASTNKAVTSTSAGAAPPVTSLPPPAALLTGATKAASSSSASHQPFGPTVKQVANDGTTTHAFAGKNSILNTAHGFKFQPVLRRSKPSLDKPTGGGVLAVSNGVLVGGVGGSKRTLAATKVQELLRSDSKDRAGGEKGDRLMGEIFAGHVEDDRRKEREAQERREREEQARWDAMEAERAKQEKETGETADEEKQSGKGSSGKRRKSDVDMDALFENTDDVFVETTGKLTKVARSEAAGATTKIDVKVAAPPAEQEQPQQEQPRRSVAALSELFKFDKKSKAASSAEEVEALAAPKHDDSGKKVAASAGSSSSGEKEKQPAQAVRKSAFGGGAARVIRQEHNASQDDDSQNLDVSAAQEPPSEEGLAESLRHDKLSKSQEKVPAPPSDFAKEGAASSGGDPRFADRSELSADISAMDTGLLFKGLNHDQSEKKNDLSQLDDEMTDAVPRELNFDATEKLPSSTNVVEVLPPPPVSSAATAPAEPRQQSQSLFSQYPSVSVAPATSLFASSSLFTNQGSSLFKSGGAGSSPRDVVGGNGGEQLEVASSIVPKLIGSGGEGDDASDRKKMPPPQITVGSGAASSSSSDKALAQGGTGTTASSSSLTSKVVGQISTVAQSWFGNPTQLGPAADPLSQSGGTKFSPCDYHSVYGGSAFGSEAAYMTAGSVGSSPEGTPLEVAGTRGRDLGPPIKGELVLKPMAAATTSASTASEGAQTQTTATKGPVVNNDTTPTNNKTPRAGGVESAARLRREQERKRLDALKSRRHAIRHLKKAEDNYELSEKCSTDEDSPDRSGKKIPDWCRNWPEKVSAQNLFDPDSIFGGKVANPDLNRIFGPDVRSKKKRRGSSENWEKDRLTKREVDAYKKRTNQLKEWPLEGTVRE
eukprot:CAMPEP_0178993722 /NCGR_PEP_ID=MMETSP0795-20121207/6865_1 /TAXON_ID=88552 /ORGANISM="Amoebophrya sp., Strain Ameob2" /LENGTH=1208 /DNA_ID=CAMNT_0020685821 /DNA_START=187 /DNA_END=3813 /DNA_ORIENTATION=+